MKPLDYAVAVGFVAYSATVTATPICLVVLARELSFSLTAGGVLEAMRGVVIVFVLLCSGFLAARFGKARALGMSCLALGVGMLLYSVSPHYGVVLLAMAVLGVGGGVVEALMNPLVQELHPEESGRYMNFSNGFWSLGVLVVMIGSGELLTLDFSWRWIMGGIGVFNLLAGVLFLWLRNKGGGRERVSMAHVLRRKQEILRSGAFWLFTTMMFLAGAIEGTFTFWSASFIQLHFGESPRAAGIGVAFFCVGMLTGRFGGGLLFRQPGLRRLLVGSAAAGLAVSLCVPLAAGVGVFFLLLFLSGLAVACFWPSIQSYAVDSLQLDPTALLILLSCGGIAGFGAASWLVGWWADLRGIRESFWILPILFALLLACFAVDRGGRVDRGRDP
ncbi:MAG: MFS transporter [Puniceicoccaceae bacterium]